MIPARILAVALLAAISLAVTPVLSDAASRSCAVDGIEGVDARAWHGGLWMPLAVGISVPSEAKIATGLDSRVNIRCDDGITVTIGPGTEVNLERLVGPSGPESSTIVQLVRGIVGIIAPNGTWGLFQVRTPVAIASVRSTEWLVEHGDIDGTAVFVRKGVVEVDSDGNAVSLAPGDGITISRTRAMSQVKQWGAERIARSGGALGFGWK